jgi:hypothetical protein
LTSHGLIDAGISTVQVVGTTSEPALIQSDTRPALTIAVQAHDIVAAYRFVEGGLQALYVAIEPKEPDSL